MKMFGKIGNIFFALWLIIITTGLLVNTHLSNRQVYSTALFVDAESCCELADEEENDPSGSCNIGDVTSSCIHESAGHNCCPDKNNPQKQDGLFYFEEEKCCSDISAFFQLAEVFYPQENSFTIQLPEVTLVAYAQIAFDYPESTQAFLLKSNHSPPNPKHTPIFIELACFRC
jgi:hypothetical protein